MSAPAGNPGMESLRRLLEARGRGLSRDLFTDFAPELEHLLLRESCRVNPDAGPALVEQFSRALRAVLPPGPLAVMPAGGYAAWVVRLLGEPEAAAMFLDNFKPEGPGPAGRPVLRPENPAAAGCDGVLLATPSVAAQVAMRRQLAAIPGLADKPVATVEQAAARALAERLADSPVLDDRVASALAALGQVRPQPGGLHILLAVTRFPQHYLPVVRALRQEGHAVSLLVLHAEMMYGQRLEQAQGEFAAVWSCGGGVLEFLRVAAGGGADALYAFDFFMENHLALLLRDLWPGRFYLEVYDFSDNAPVFPPSRLKREAEERTGLRLIALDELCRERVYRAADGIVYRDGDSYLERTREAYGMATPALRFLPYPTACERLSETDGEPHAAFIGHIPPDPDGLVYTVLGMARQAAAQGVHMHVYNPSDPEARELGEFTDLAAADPRVHYHRPLPLAELTAVLRLYDWGWMAYDFSGQSPEDVARHAHTFTSRLLTYVSAGLPVVCSRESAYQAELVERHGIGVVVGPEDIPALGRILREQDMAALRRNVAALRREWDMARRVKDLAGFLQNPSQQAGSTAPDGRPGDGTPRT